MIKDWFKNRLVPDKQNTELWSSFAEAIQTLYESDIEPIIKRISDRRSFFTMAPEDLDTRASEYGRFFVMGEVDQSQKAMLLTQRLDEIHFKGTTRPIEQTFWREFGNLPVTWQPLYAPVNTDEYPYGSYLITEDAISVAQTTYGEFFLTSRGNIQVDLNALYEYYGIGDRDNIIKTLLEKFDLIIAPLMPLHMVFDGISLLLAFKLADKAERFTLFEQVVSIAGMKWSAKADNLTTVGLTAGTYLNAYRSDNSMTQVALSMDQYPLDAWLLDAPPVNTLVQP
ncbi:phage tail protein [Rosenbergiella metrosideri]|uniref:phage tail protein n=1 Tax=Rosenbergiella metrosideri TaxID=2921185 RepID=UPI001F4FFE88|nr:phage tail protein [Rosenbergiella metrosideri]